MINCSPTRITDIIHFHGVTLMVYTHEGVQYVAAKPLSDLVEMDWRTTKRTIIEPENATLYGSTQLNVAENASEGGTSPTPVNSILCIRLDRARMFLARINTRIMKAKGNVEAAETLLKLQVEWAQVLHDYETKGFANKGNQRQQQSQLIGLMKARTLTKNPAEQMVLTQMIHHLCQDMGYPITQNQADLFS